MLIITSIILNILQKSFFCILVQFIDKHKYHNVLVVHVKLVVYARMGLFEEGLRQTHILVHMGVDEGWMVFESCH